MADTMISIVANAIGHDSDCALHNAPALPVGPCDCSAVDRAHDAILAMREPTESMIVAGVQGPLGDMEGRYQAMIDAALNEKGSGT